MGCQNHYLFGGRIFTFFALKNMILIHAKEFRGKKKKHPYLPKKLRIKTKKISNFHIFTIGSNK
jgi:hypothetical protein